MNALALVVGNNNYDNPDNRLINAVNDANDFSAKLLSLGFNVIKKTDSNRLDFDHSLLDFSNKLEKYDVGLFYFSGHGLQIKGVNYLTMTDTSFADATSAKYTSFELDEVIERMQKKNVLIKILILDACRNNPLPDRGINPGLAPVRAPKGTIIAFSTSPGETAMDYGAGHNSIYTGALLKHIGDENIPIEDFFKRVRTTVYTLSGGRQTSWEHTSLIGNFCFNSGQLVHSLDLPYRDDCIADSKFVSTGSTIDKIIEGLKSQNWYLQGPAVNKLRTIKITDIDSSEQFLLGRNLLSAAIGNEFSALHIFNNLSVWLNRWRSKLGYCHVLNGILYEIYFDSEGKFRNDKFKSEMIDEVFTLENDKQYAKSFKFIQKQLEMFRDFLCYIPSPKSVSLPIDIVVEDELHGLDADNEKLKVISISVNGRNIMHIEDEDAAFKGTSFEDFKDELHKEIVIPKSKMTISVNKEIDDSTRIYIPYGRFIKMG